jgi:hypothetical protein
MHYYTTYYYYYYYYYHYSNQELHSSDKHPDRSVIKVTKGFGDRGSDPAPERSSFSVHTDRL